MNQIMNLNEYIVRKAESKLINYVEFTYDNMYTEEEVYEEMDKYYTGDYEIHLTYLIETWKNSIDDIQKHFIDDVRIDYNYKGTFDELDDYFEETSFAEFEYTWLDDIFVHDILHTNVCLK
jgi:hypothetical protein